MAKRSSYVMETVTIKFDEQPSGQWIGSSPEIKNFMVAEDTLPEALHQAGLVVATLQKSVHWHGKE